jgi:hypothetical protein
MAERAYIESESTYNEAAFQALCAGTEKQTPKSEVAFLRHAELPHLLESLTLFNEFMLRLCRATRFIIRVWSGNIGDTCHLWRSVSGKSLPCGRQRQQWRGINSIP